MRVPVVRVVVNFMLAVGFWLPSLGLSGSGFWVGLRVECGGVVF